MSADRRALVERLLAGRVSLRGVARATGLSRAWLQRFANALFRDPPRWGPGPLPKKSAARGS